MTTTTTTTTTITNQVPGYYKCGHCALHFKTRPLFRAHEATCLSLKQIRARATFSSPSQESVTVRDLLALVQQLAVRLETTEREVQVLKQQQQQQQQQQQPQGNRNQQPGGAGGAGGAGPMNRRNLLQWLQSQPPPPVVFSEWLSAVPAFTRDDLALVFQHGFIDGMCGIIAGKDCSPIRAYYEAPGTLFVYEHDEHDDHEHAHDDHEHEHGGQPDGKHQWRTMTHAEFERFINRMQKLLMNEFVGWQQEHKERWHDPDFAEQYDVNLLKVTGSGKAKGGGCSNRDMLITRMKPKVHATISVNMG
jgi:hypothetical protein